MLEPLVQNSDDVLKFFNCVAESVDMEETISDLQLLLGSESHIAQCDVYILYPYFPPYYCFP